MNFSDQSIIHNNSKALKIELRSGEVNISLNNRVTADEITR